MFRAVVLSFFSTIAALLLGCTSTTSEVNWVHAQGGVVQDARLSRAQAACDLLGSSANRTVHVHVLDSDSIGAYGWPNGNLFITRGLIDRLTDQELAAAIAHEMGHLLNDGHLQTYVSLRGCSVSPDIEARADAIGVRLLAQHGLGRDVMVSMLNKVRCSPGLAPLCQQRIAQRIELLSDQSQPTNSR